MIGGIEIQIPTGGHSSALEEAVRSIYQKWPHAVFENGITGERYEHLWQVPFEHMDEIFVYRDAAAADIWETEGAIPAVYNTMIHLLPGGGSLTLVVDKHDLEIDQIVAAVTSELAPHKRS